MNTNWSRQILVIMISLGAMAIAACQSVPNPAPLDSHNDQCQTCRMIVSDKARASQIVAPYEEPRFFDDLSCLAAYLAAHPPASGAVVYVADHRTRDWVRWDRAVYTRVPALGGAMGPPVLAHATVASRDADIQATGGTPLEWRDVFPGFAAGGPPGGR